MSPNWSSFCRRLTTTSSCSFCRRIPRWRQRVRQSATLRCCSALRICIGRARAHTRARCRPACLLNSASTSLNWAIPSGGLSFGETDATVNAKVKTALRHGLRPLVCVGDTALERDAGASVETIVRQVKLAFAGLQASELDQCLVAYEPVWAIGELGVPAQPEHVRIAHTTIRRALKERTAHHVPILYGGSVNVANAAQLAKEREVDGLFVGRAAWTAPGFAGIVSEALSARRTLTDP